MRIKVHPVVLGGFVLGAVALVVVLLFTIGAGNPFQETAHFVCYATSSAEGLDAGTAIRLNGVRVGQVQQVKVFYDSATRNADTQLLCKLRYNRLIDTNGTEIKLTDERVLQRLVHEGLRAQIKTSGIVGAKFIDLNFSTAEAPPLQAGLPASKYPVIPMIPSRMAQIEESASKIMTDLQKTDLPGLSEKLQTLLAGLDQQVHTLQTNHLTDHIATAAESLGHLASSDDVQQTLASFHEAAAHLNALITNLDVRVGPLANQADQTLVSVNNTANSLRDFVGLRDQLGQQAQDLMQQLEQTARTIEQLSDFLQQHPNALISGRAQEPNTP